MIPSSPASPLRAAFLVGEAVFIQVARRKDAYVLLLFGALFLLSVGIVRLVGVDSPATSTFILNLGLTMAWALAHLMTLFLSARQIPDEMESRTLHPLLAKPLSRTSLLLGKWGACTLCGFAVYLSLLVLVWLPTPKLEEYRFALLVQGIVVQFFSLGLLASLSLMLSLLTPRGTAAVIAALVFFFGSKAPGFGGAMFRESAFLPMVRWIALYIPDFGKLNLTTRYTDGIAPLGLQGFLGLCIYAAIFGLFFLVVSRFVFERRRL